MGMSHEVRDMYPKRFLTSLLVVAAIGLLGGCAVMRWSLRSKTAQLQEELLSEVTSITRELNITRVKALSFTKADLTRAEHLRLAHQLQAYARYTGGHSVFCVARRNSAYVYGPGNLTDSDGRLIEPGTVYPRPPRALAAAFRERQSQVSGPYMDAAGVRVVSAWVPVLDTPSDEILMVMGLTVKAQEWRHHFLRMWWGAGLFSVSLIGCVALAVFLAGKSRRIPVSMQRRVGQIEVALVVLVGLIFTVTLARMTRNVEMHSRWANFQVYARSEARDVSRALAGLRTRIDSLSLLLGDEKSVGGDTFMRYVSPMMQFGFAEKWGWVPIVPVADMMSFEVEVRKRGVPGFTVWQNNEHGSRVPVLWRDAYFPVLFCESAANEKSLAGFDCGSDPALRQAIDTCMSSGIVTGSIALKRTDGKAEGTELFVFQPVYASKMVPREMKGFILVILDLRKLFRHTFAPAVSDSRPHISADLCELSTSHQPQILVSSSAAAGASGAARFQRPDGYSLSLTAPLFFFGRAYAVSVRAEPAYLQEHPMRLGLATGLAGGVLTMLLAGFVGLLSNRRSDLEQQVNARTAELARVNQQLGTILDSVVDGIVSVDHLGRFTVVNVSAAQMLGYEIGELIGAPCERLWMDPHAKPAGSLAETVPVYATYTYGTTYTSVDNVFFRKDGSRFHVALVSKPISVQGLVMGAVITFEDITERQAAEENLRLAYSELASVNNQLRDASQAKNQFLAHMSHEIRTPLNCVIGMSGLLMNTTLTEEQQEYAETIRISGESLLSIVNEILDFSKIEAQKLELEKQPFDLRHCLEDAVDLVAPSAIAKKLELLYLIDESLPKVWMGDVTRLRQILVNLLSNAVKFTEHGEVEVTVSGKPFDDRKTELHFSVRDTGLGISPEAQVKLFESFHQCDASTTRRFGGTGLGLAISKRLCELMGGGMSVESSGVPGCGTTFHFSVVMEPDHTVREADLVPYSQTVGKRVLIIIGNKSGRDGLSRQVQALGMVPVPVTSGREALDLLGQVDLFGKSEQFDMAIVDAKTENASGVEMAHALRGFRGCENLRLIMLEPLGEHVGKESCPPFVEHLTKPVKLASLYDAVGRLFAAQPPQPRKADRGQIMLDGEIGRQHPLRILVAEDNVVNQKVAASILKKLGYRADLVSNGYEALEAVKCADYDLVLMDVQMPEMDGEQAARMIRRELPAKRQPWIVAMTANVMKEDRERYQAAGMNDYIPKPVRVEHLMNILLSVQPVSVCSGLDALAGGASGTP